MTNNGGGNQPIISQQAPVLEIFNQSCTDHDDHVAQVTHALNSYACKISGQAWKLRGETPSDGNCFFWAVSDQLARIGLAHQTHDNLRHDVVNFIRNLPKPKKIEIERFLTTSLHSYLDTMKKNGTYADHVTAQATSTMLELHIQIIHANPEDKVVLHPLISDTRSNKVIAVGYLPDIQHYVSLNRLQTEDFVAVKLVERRRQRIYVAKVLQIDADDVQLRFLKPSSRIGIYVWPETDDVSWQPLSDIVKTLRSPKLVPGRGIKLDFNNEVFSTAESDDEPDLPLPISVQVVRSSGSPAASPVKRPVPSASQRSKKRKRKHDSMDATDAGSKYHHTTYIMKLFDRSVDLAQFNEKTPLYPIARAWMKDNTLDDAESSQDESSADEKDDPSNVFKMPTPIKLKFEKGTGFEDTRIPPPLITTDPPLDIHKDPDLGPAPEELLLRHMARWKSIRQSWINAARINELKYNNSMVILKDMYEKNLQSQEGSQEQ